MLITVKGRAAVIIQDDVVLRVLSLYPEEELAQRPVFREGLGTGRLEFRKFKDECDIVQLPWQIFFLSISELERELKNIEANRLAKAPKTLLAKRHGNGRTTSRRILDRLIRSQGYLSGDASLGGNAFCGALKRLSVADAAERILGHFNIDMSVFRGKRKNAALEYLIKKFEEGQINVSQGVLTNKILPQFGDARSVYKNTSGFTMRAVRSVRFYSKRSES
jgi:hypothetical protein